MSFTISCKRFFLSFVLICSINVSAQEKCGQEQFVRQQLQNDDYKERHLILQKRIAEQINQNRQLSTFQNSTNTIIVPVAIHFPEAVESDRACLVALAQNQIDILNADFNATNAESVNWANDSAYYPNTNLGVTDVFFCIANLNHPQNIDPNLIEGEPAITIGYDFGAGSVGTVEDANWYGYVNILVKDLSIGGYSPLGGSVSNGEAFVVASDLFGSGVECVMSGVGNIINTTELGRATVHEMGHFLNLKHTFSIGCWNDDGIIDTPNQSSGTIGCPNLGTVPACDENEQVLFQNFMDYTEGFCQYMFTQGQVDVMRAYLMTIQNDFRTDVLSCSLHFNTSDNSQVICNALSDVVEYTISYNEPSDNPLPITFTINGLPTNANYNFNPATLSGNGTTVLTLSNLGQVLPDDYNITVSGSNITNDELNLYLSIENQEPPVPNLLSPINNDEVNPLLVNLEWEFVEEASSYFVEVSTNSSFSNIIFSETTSETLLNVNDLSEGTSYFWRVKAINSCGESVHSQTENFVTSAVICQLFNSTENNILIPNNGGEPYLITSTLYINADVQLNDVNVTININHASTQDLEVTITSPQGTEVILTSHNGDDGDNYVNTTFSQQAENPISEASAPFTGFYIPEGDLNTFNNQSALGNWVLTVADMAGQLASEFQNFSLELCGIETLGLNDFSPQPSLKIWPNPSKGILNVAFLSNYHTTEIKLLDLRGRLINSFNFKNHPSQFVAELDLGTLSKSVYILQIQSGKTIVNQRLIID